MNLDDVIDIDYSLVDIESYNMREAFSPFSGTKPNGKQFFLVSSRGCPFKCVFCMRSADDDKSMRFASVDAVIKHVRDLIERYDMSVLTFYDDQILFNKKRAKQLFKELEQFNLRIECPNGLSVAFIDDELASLMKKAGMDTINLAIESGSPHVLNEIIHKPLKLNMVKPVVDILRKHGFWIHGFFVSGIPGETDDNRDETIKFIKDVALDWSGFSLAIPSRGSELYRICVDNGYIKKDLAIDELNPNKYIINTPEYSPEHVIKKTYLMNLDVNFVNNYRMKHGDYETAAKAFKEVLKITPDHAFAHFYLAKALERIGKDPAAVNDEVGHFRTIIEENEEWKGYAQFFKIA